MALRIGENAQQVSTSTGTGNFSLNANSTGSETRDLTVAIGLSGGASAQVPYFIQHGAAFETGIGTLTQGLTDTLARNTVKVSSNNNNRVNFGTGSKIVTLGNAAWMFETLINLNRPVIQMQRTTINNTVFETQSTSFIDMGVNASITPIYPNSTIECVVMITRGEAIRVAGSPVIRQAEVRIWSQTHAAGSQMTAFGDVNNDAPSSTNRSIHGGIYIEMWFNMSTIEEHEFRVQYRTTNSNVQARIAQRTTLFLKELRN